jgi:hypothetical protein
VNGVDPAGLWTNGLGLGFDLSGFGLTGGGNAMVSEDENGERVLEFSAEYGASNDFGFGATGTYQKTDAKSVDQLKGKSSKVGGEVAAPTPIGSVGVGLEHVKGSDYEGENHNLSWSPKFTDYDSPAKPVKGSLKHEKTWTFKVPKIQREYDPDLW